MANSTVTDETGFNAEPLERGAAANVRAEPPSRPSYGQILSSSSITGGSQAICLVIGMIRAKAVALLLGPTGVGEVAAFLSAIDVVSKASGLGIGSSAIREVSASFGKGDTTSLSRTVAVLRRVCWLTGLLGWILVIALADRLSHWTFGNGDHTFAIMLIGSTVLLSQVTAGQAAIIRGTRRIRELALRNIAAAVLTTAISIALYAWLGRNGIVPVIVAAAICTLVTSWSFSRHIHVEPVKLDWSETLSASRRLIGLGASFMFSGVFAACATWLIQSLVTTNFGSIGNGMYAAAWALSIQFVTFILAAMAADFFPRLAASSADHGEMNRLLNEQAEVGVFLALPGVVAIMAFAPWLVRVFYSAQFLGAIELLPWFAAGMFGRVVSWPLGYLQIAMGRSRLYLITEGCFSLLHVALAFAMTRVFGLVGVAIAFAALYVLYSACQSIVAAKLSGFRWNQAAWAVLIQSTAVLAIGLVISIVFSGNLAIGINAFLAVAAALWSVRGLTSRLGPEHRISQFVRRIPGIQILIGSNG